MKEEMVNNCASSYDKRRKVEISAGGVRRDEQTISNLFYLLGHREAVARMLLHDSNEELNKVYDYVNDQIKKFLNLD